MHQLDRDNDGWVLLSKPPSTEIKFVHLQDPQGTQSSDRTLSFLGTVEVCAGGTVLVAFGVIVGFDLQAQGTSLRKSVFPCALRRP